MRKEKGTAAGIYPTRRQALIGGAVVAVGATVNRDASATQCVAKSELDVRTQGAVGDGIADDTTAIQRAYDALAAQGGGTLYFSAGTYRVNLRLKSRLVHLRGAGRGVSTLRPGSTQPVLRALYANASWDAIRISDLSIAGAGQKGDIGFMCGEDTYARLDEYVGRTIFERVGWSGLHTSIARPYGNIGLAIDDCTFDDADYHIWTVSNTAPGDPMHGGVVNVRRSRFIGFKKAMFYINSSNAPGGQISFEDCIIENAPGFPFYIRAFDGADSTPSIRVSRTWNESTARGRDIEVEGERHPTASFLHASNCTAPILFEDTPVGDMVLRATQVSTRGCSLDLLRTIDMDRSSQVFHWDARMLQGTPPGLCRSVLGPTNAQGLRTPWFKMPLPTARAPLAQEQVLQLWDGGTPRPFTGTVQQISRTVEGDAAIPGLARSQQITILAGQQLWPEPLFDIPASSWIVMLYIARLLSGAPVHLQLNGSRGASGAATLTEKDWQMLASVVEMPAQKMQKMGLLHSVKEGRSEIRVGGLALLSFKDRQSAVAFVNRMVFPA